MNYITKVGLSTLILVGLYSCHTPNKIAKTDTTKIVDTAKKSLTLQNISPSTDVEIDTSEPLKTQVIFPDFSVKINNAGWFAYKAHNNDKVINSGDTISLDARNYKMWKLTTKLDTVHLITDDGMGLNIGAVEIIPVSKSDRFEISYSFKLEIIAENGKDGTLWASMMPFKKIKDSLNYYFISPKHNYIYSEEGLKINEIKKKFNLKDTSFKKEADNSDYGTYTENGVIFKNELCEIPYTTFLYIKIDRFNADKLMETKYLVVDFDIPE